MLMKGNYCRMPTVAAYCILCHCGSKTLSILKDQLASFRIEELVSSVLIEKKKERVELDSRSYTRNSMNNAFCWAWLKKKRFLLGHTDADRVILVQERDCKF
jgi:hypothetical protein